jgi:hypothetical protein
MIRVDIFDKHAIQSPLEDEDGDRSVQVLRDLVDCCYIYILPQLVPLDLRALESLGYQIEHTIFKLHYKRYSTIKSMTRTSLRIA